MNGQRFHTFRASAGGLSKLTTGGVRFFALDRNYLSKEQLDWLDKQLGSSNSNWRIAFFHHPFYSSGRTHGSALETRAVLEPLFAKHVVSLVLTDHDHIYERIRPTIPSPTLSSHAITTGCATSREPTPIARTWIVSGFTVTSRKWCATADSTRVAAGLLFLEALRRRVIP